jgi:hypothetical protein
VFALIESFYLKKTLALDIASAAVSAAAIVVLAQAGLVLSSHSGHTDKNSKTEV